MKRKWGCKMKKRILAILMATILAISSMGIVNAASTSSGASGGGGGGGSVIKPSVGSGGGSGGGTAIKQGQEGIFTYEIKNNMATITECDEDASGEIVIPSTIGGCPVVAIGEYLFSYNTNITSVIIPEGVTEIETSAFDNCTNLINITIPDSVTTIGEYAFDSCESLVSLELPKNLTSVEWGAFRGCNSLTSIEIPSSVTTIPWWAFESCENLESVIIPDSVTVIGDSAFSECTSLANIEIPDSVTTIEEDAFSGCSSLESIYIPKSVTTIEDEVFYACTKLTSITVDAKNPNYTSVDGVLFDKNKTTIMQYPAGKSGTTYSIPNGVTTISVGAFAGCKTLTNISLPVSDVAIFSRRFNSIFCISGSKKVFFISTHLLSSSNNPYKHVPLYCKNGDWCRRYFRTLQQAGRDTWHKILRTGKLRTLPDGEAAPAAPTAAARPRQIHGRMPQKPPARP